MDQSTWHTAGLHLGIIMDGNGRWATRRGRPRLDGHQAGADAIRRVVRASAGQGLAVLTLFAFSEDNWHRPPAEVGGLMRLFRRFLVREAGACLRQGVRLNVIGRRDRMDGALLQAIEQAELLTRGCRSLLVRLAVDYSSRSVIAAAGRNPSDTAEAFRRRIETACHSVGGVGDVDLLIRTGAERRLSDFLLWESAYAELFFTDIMWPEFTPADLLRALEDFRARDRRFGRVPAAG